MTTTIIIRLVCPKCGWRCDVNVDDTWPRCDNCSSHLRRMGEDPEVKDENTNPFRQLFP